MTVARINGIELYYECVGAGPPLLLIHGLGSSGDDWAFQREAFAPRHWLVLIDLRGSGRSGKPPGPYSMTQFADDLWQLLDRLGIRDTDVLGFSLGGSVAIEMALMRPERVRRMILCNALADYRLDTARKWLEASLHVGLVRLLGVRHVARLIARRMFPRPEQAPMRRRVIEVVGGNPQAAYLATIQAIVGWSALERLHALACDTLLIAAEHDYAPLALRHAEAARYPRAELTVIPGSRHGTPFDAADAFNACTLEFLARRADTPQRASPGHVEPLAVDETAGVFPAHRVQHG